jgi:hypothetical protein
MPEWLTSYTDRLTVKVGAWCESPAQLLSGPSCLATLTTNCARYQEGVPSQIGAGLQGADRTAAVDTQEIHFAAAEPSENASEDVRASGRYLHEEKGDPSGIRELCVFTRGGRQVLGRGLEVLSAGSCPVSKTIGRSSCVPVQG